MTHPTSTRTSELDPTPAAPEPPLPSFDALPLSPELRETLADMGYTSPTPVQLAVWEPVTRGKDAVVQARTGTGKTAAFGIPIVDHVVRRSAAHAQVLVLCPTRELAIQVSREIERLSKRKAVATVAIYGGAPMPKQVEQLQAGAQVIVGTPGRTLDHLRRGTLDAKGLRLLVLDESDEMLSMGFERELNAILDFVPAERQTLLFSATVPPDIERIARNKLKTPEFITLSGDHIGALSIQHFVYMVAGDKLSALVRVIEVENPEGAVVFCNTKDDTERVAQALSQRGYDADWLNGDLPQSDREKVMARTRAGKLRFLVATDVAARGIDISHLTHVINFDFPQDAESYVHRTGRTGRAGRTGTAISLIAPRDIGGLYLLRLTYKIRPIEKQIPTEGELKTRAEADLAAMLAEAFLANPADPSDLALARRLLTHEQAEAIVAGMLRDHLGARPTAQEEAEAARRSTRQPARSRPSRERERAPAPPPHARPSPAVRMSERSEPVSWSDAREASKSDASKTDSPPVVALRPERAVLEAAAPEPRAPERARRRPRGEPVGESAAAPRPAPSLPRPASTLGAAGAPAPSPRQGRTNGPRHADFATWQPPEEEGDDQPILAAADQAGAPSRERAPRRGAERPGPSADRPGPAVAPAATPLGTEAEDLAEVFVNVGRRDGARAADLARLLTERAGVASEDVKRIRVRERNAFVSVHKNNVAKVIAALSGAPLGNKTAQAELARQGAPAEEAVEGPPTPRHDG
jgi:ATP-dependent RNA helicase DeaD